MIFLEVKNARSGSCFVNTWQTKQAGRRDGIMSKRKRSKTRKGGKKPEEIEGKKGESFKKDILKRAVSSFVKKYLVECNVKYRHEDQGFYWINGQIFLLHNRVGSSFKKATDKEAIEYFKKLIKVKPKEASK